MIVGIEQDNTLPQISGEQAMAHRPKNDKAVPRIGKKIKLVPLFSLSLL